MSDTTHYVRLAVALRELAERYAHGQRTGESDRQVVLFHSAARACDTLVATLTCLRAEEAAHAQAQRERDEAVAWLVAQAPGHATCYARVTAGDEGTATAGHGGMLAIRRWDGRRYRLVVGYVGENGIEAGVPYRLDADGRFVRAEAQR